MPTQKVGIPRSFSISIAVLFLAAAIGVGAWLWFSLPRLSILSLRIDRPAALTIARDYLHREFGIDPSLYRSASVFQNEGGSDTFLQRVLGSKGERDFLKKYGYDLFYWRVRFFRPGEKEEYRLTISSRTGEVIQHTHLIEESAQRPKITKEKARAIAVRFLTEKVGVPLSDYVIKDESHETKDKREEFGFSWRHKDVDIVWDRLPSAEKAKLLVGVVMAGDEVREFSRNDLSVPEDFSRFMDREMEWGRNLSLVFSVVFLLCIIAMIADLIQCRQHLAMRTARPVLIRLGILLGAVAFASVWNYSEGVLMGYPTSQNFRAFWDRTVFSSGVSSILSGAAFVLMALAAESTYARYPLVAGSRGGFSFYARSSFLTRGVAASVGIGILLACALLGLQSVLFAFGEKYCGVWTGEQWITDFSSAYWPFLAAFFVAYKASLNEEIIFRVFTLHWLGGRLKNIVAVVVIAALFWGFGHSGYPIFPMWFRGIEVTILGLVFCLSYLRFGLITVLVAHYLFDAFWGSAGPLLSPSAPVYFWSALAVLLLPFVWAVWAWIADRSSDVRPLNWQLNPAQGFHLKVLTAFVEQQRRAGVDIQALRHDCLRNGWDPAVVEVAFGVTPGDGTAGENKTAGA